MNEPVILCIDDERIVLDSLKREIYDALGEQYLIETAENGEEALEVFQELLADNYEIPAVVSDNIMPGMGGSELLQHIHAIAPDTLKIMLTGQADIGAVIHAVNNANLYRYITKPWEPTDLILTIKEAICKYFQEKKLEEQHRQLAEQHRQLQKAHQELATFNEHLEREVRERTAALQQANAKLHRLANLDGLTRVANRRRFDEYFAQEWRRMNRERMPLTLIMCDIDYFKPYNDTYGHQTGDDCLRQIAAALQQSVQRPADLVRRYGGEEFIITLPDTDSEGALHVAEQIQTRVKALQIEHTASQVADYVTLSIGLASSAPRASGSADDLLAAADTALYTAKHRGRNCIVVKNQQMEETA